MSVWLPSSPFVPDRGTHRSFKQLRFGVLMLNIAAAHVALQHARRQAELHDRHRWMQRG